MPRRLPQKTKNIERKPRFSSQRFFNPDSFFQRTPVKVNDELEVVIDDIGSRGDGIARISGYMIFVPRARVGERIKVRILDVNGNYAIAERIEPEKEAGK